MFGRRDIDDLDDYQREKEEERRERRSYSSVKVNSETTTKADKRPKVDFEELSDGSVKYVDKNINFMIFIPFIMFLTFGGMMLAVVKSVMGANMRIEDSISSLTPIFFMFVFIFGIYFFSTLGPSTKNVTIYKDKITAGKLSIPYDSFRDFDIRRTYGKNHSYTGTRYKLVYQDPNTHKERKILLKFMNTFTISHLIHTARKYASDNSSNYVNGEVFETRRFAFPEALSKRPSQSFYLLMLVPFSIFFVFFFMAIFSAQFSSVPGLFAPFVVFICLMLFSIIASVVSLKKKFGTLSFPENIFLDQDSIKVNELCLRPSEIKAIYITPVGRSNPRANQSSSLYIVTEEQMYSYMLGVFYPDRLAYYNQTLPEWEYGDFYATVNSWCKANKVDCIDFIL